MKHYFESPVEAASGLKFDIDNLIDIWFEDHDVFDDTQRRLIRQAFRKAGFEAFTEELISYFESSSEYVVNVDDSIIYDDGFGDEVDDYNEY
jgi:hypothetical protein